jgi:N,N'-diacetylchitobiose phosphorylase
MTGSGGWSYFSATRYMLGIRPDFEELVIDPCIPKEWSGFEADRVWRDTTYHIRVENQNGVMKGVKTLLLDGKKVNNILPQQPQTTHTVTVIMG